MPYIEIKTTQKLTREQKIQITEKLTEAFAKASSPDCAKNIQYSVEDGVFMNFKGNYNDPTANVYVRPGYLTPESDYEKIVLAFFPVLTELLDIPKNRIYISFNEVRAWGFDGIYVPPKPE